MTVNGRDPVLAALGELAEAPPRGLADRVFSDWVRVPSAFGDLYVAFSGQGVNFVRPVDAVRGEEEFAAEFHRELRRPLRAAQQPPSGLVTALRRNRTRSVRVDLRHLTDFERAVLETARTIPAGQTRPYSWVAREIGSPRAVRSVGSALARNPVPVLVPCHRVTRADGEPGEYVFGAEFGERLLRAEDVDVDEVRELARSDVFYLGSDTTNIVCFPTCHNARRISAPHRRGFRSVDAARKAGYRPCKHCRPALAGTA
ncbi:methylated-DNA--[protein]-cysteine S-methyltransferase [Saccharopolyspora taberi]|uniref:Methylated-DNA--[protein]-cysteine S-methyltransferase n=1 Tax=Saccharopolyspora taberi TaxID=60895 RepID=A0ABN3VDN6_9PSEU